jgi:hypothetical protein
MQPSSDAHIGEGENVQTYAKMYKLLPPISNPHPKIAGRPRIVTDPAKQQNTKSSVVRHTPYCRLAATVRRKLNAIRQHAVYHKDFLRAFDRDLKVYFTLKVTLKFTGWKTTKAFENAQTARNARRSVPFIAVHWPGRGFLILQLTSTNH